MPIPKAGSETALKCLDAFRPKIDAYGEARDFPNEEATSRLSIYLKNGSITVAQIIASLGLTAYQKGDRSGRARYLSELIWREFYYHVLYWHPRVEKEPFLPQFASIPWENKQESFTAWCAGLTGYPIVDAGMRELKTTGWMHNRVRMIVASFLTKDLLIDWRWGERYFMEQLLDGDLAPNNGGWQWAASTGCDPQPYFRIFNPELQSRKFDPEGHYIKKFVPELRHVPASSIHNPPASMRRDYPAQIIDHRLQRDRALMLYSKAAKPKKDINS